MNLDAFTQGYLEAALFSTNDESTPCGGVPLDENYGLDDIDPTCLANLVAECERFQRDHWATIYAVIGTFGPYGKLPCSEDGIGADFWFTRNDHGVGFDDGDYPDPHAKTLYEAAKAYGEVYLYVGDDGKVYASGYETIAVCA